jgi:hypothetical protein
MARYNTVISSATASTTAAFTSPGSGAFTKLTGTTYTVTIGDPVLFSGQNQTFYNAASGTITLSFSTGGGGTFVGPGGSGTTNQTLSTGTTITLYSDGTNWVTLGAGGGPIIATTGTFSSDITLSGSTPTINFNSTAPTIATNSASSTAAVFNTSATTVNLGGAASTINFGLPSSTSSIVNIYNKLSIKGSTSGSVTFAAAATAGSVTYTLPSADAASSGYALVSNGSGTLSWAATGATIADDTSTTTLYPVMGTTTSGSLTAVKTSSTKFSFNALTGTMTVTAITESSSIALKQNVVPIDNALDSILKLVGVTYDRKDGTSNNEAGLIAEHVNKVLPNIVSKDENGDPIGIHYTKLTAYLIESVKALKDEIDQLKGTKVKKQTKGK